MTTKQQTPSPTSNGTPDGLEFVTPDPDVHPNILLYGPPKSGKSMGAGSASGKILYLNADRPNAIRQLHTRYGDRIKEVQIKGLPTLIAAMDAIRSGTFDTVVLDPVGECYTRILEGLSGRALSPAIQMYGDTGVHLERFIKAVCDEPVTFVVVAHEHSIKDDASGEFERLPWTGTNNPALAEKILAAVDVIAYTGVVPGEGDEPPRYMAQLIDAHGRRGGDRFGVLGVSRDVNLKEWVELAQNEIGGPVVGQKEE